MKKITITLTQPELADLNRAVRLGKKYLSELGFDDLEDIEKKIHDIYEKKGKES